MKDARHELQVCPQGEMVERVINGQTQGSSRRDDQWFGEGIQDSWPIFYGAD